MKILLTGASGFAGSHIAEKILQDPDSEIVVLDRLSYAGRLDRLSHLPRSRMTVIHHDFRASFPAWLLKKLDGVQGIIHNGAETHVGNSLVEPEIFVQSNVLGTFHVLEAARRLQVDKFIYISTDEVYGAAPEGVSYTELDRLSPSTPYAATKMGGEALVQSYGSAFHVPVVISRSMNLFGERQHPEKFIPMTLKNVLLGREVIIHASPEGKSGTRKWMYVRNQAEGVMFLLQHGRPREIYNMAGEERSNLEVATAIADCAGKPLYYEISDIAKQRPGHDLRYSIDDTKLRNAGWIPQLSFDHSIKKTISWTLRHLEWLEE